MKRAALSLALCALAASTAAAQSSPIEVAASGRKVELSVQVVPASSEKIARAAERAPEPDGVMVMPVPGSDWVLRTEKFKATGDITTMAPAGDAKMSASGSESTCTTRWMSGSTPHSLVSTLANDESMAAWSQRHQEALFMITAVFPSAADAKAVAVTPDAAGQTDLAKTPWTDASGQAHEVMTKRREGEAREAWLARHQSAVKAFAALMQPKT